MFWDSLCACGTLFAASYFAFGQEEAKKKTMSYRDARDNRDSRDSRSSRRDRTSYFNHGNGNGLGSQGWPAAIWAKQSVSESNMNDLRADLFALPPDRRRAALSLLGLAIGDAVGLPYELGFGTLRRSAFRSLRTASAKKDHVFNAMVQRCLKRSHNPFVRTFSDDTVCSDLKMEAAAQVNFLFDNSHSSGFPSTKYVAEELRKALLQQYLKWAYIAQVRGDRPGCLFQGVGGFTSDFLWPKNRNAVSQAMRSSPMYEDHQSLGPWYPTQHFSRFAEAYFRGEHGYPSWGNGAVMSMAPQPILQGSWRHGTNPIAPQLCSSAAVLSKSHQEPTAELAAKLMADLLSEIYQGLVPTTASLRHAVQGLSDFRQLQQLQHDCIPVAPFNEWLQHGDCTQACAEYFLERLTGESAGRDHFGIASASRKGNCFHAMLSVAADWDNDHSLGLAGFPPKLQRRNSREPVLFSQRALNSLIIGIYSASDATEVWDVLIKVLDIGGDTDTVGAVAGQIAAPLLDPADVAGTFEDFVALAGPAAQCTRSADFGLKVANAAARRFFRRALLFAAGDLGTLRLYPSLVDPGYANLTDETGTRILAKY